MTKSDTTAEPNEALTAAAADGDKSAIHELAEWYRRRNRPAGVMYGDVSDEQLAFQVECFGFELEERRLQARKLRRLLSLLPKEPLAFGPIVHATKKGLEDHVSAFGLPLTVRLGQRGTVDGRAKMVYSTSFTDKEAHEYTLVAPTDDDLEDETRAAILAFFARSFTDLIPIEVSFYNEPLSQAGDDVLFALGLREV